jgi:hypothetical protein
MTEFTEGSQMRTNAGSPKTEKPSIAPKGQMTNQANCNHRTPPKHHVDYLDEQMVIVNGVQYQRVEEQKPQTLYEIIREWNDNEDYPTCEELVSRIVKWLPTERCEDGEEYYIGWNDCLRQLKEKLK